MVGPPAFVVLLVGITNNITGVFSPSVDVFFQLFGSLGLVWFAYTKKRLSKKVSIITSLIIVVLATSLFVTRYDHGSLILEIKDTLLTPKIDNHTEWSTYTVDQFGFSFEYPKNWVVVEREGFGPRAEYPWVVNFADSSKSEYINLRLSVSKVGLGDFLYKLTSGLSKYGIDCKEETIADKTGVYCRRPSWDSQDFSLLINGDRLLSVQVADVDSNVLIEKVISSLKF